MEKALPKAEAPLHGLSFEKYRYQHQGSMSKISIISRSERDTLGEGPIWSSRQNSLFWVDILQHKIHSMNLDTCSFASWSLREAVGWIIERRDAEGFIIGLKSGFAFFRPYPFSLQRIGNPEPDRPDNRLNDAKVDLHGRIWAGSKDDPEQQASGALYRLDPNLTWSRQDDGYLVTNGPAFSLDGRTLLHSDSGARKVFAFDLNEDGSLSRKRLWLQFPDEWGHPDGMTTDAEGGIWIAHWGGARISRFSPDGVLDRVIQMPATNITSMTFARPDLRSMFVTSAGLGHEGEPAAGALFEVDAGVRGLAPRYFAG